METTTFLGKTLFNGGHFSLKVLSAAVVQVELHAVLPFVVVTLLIFL